MAKLTKRQKTLAGKVDSNKLYPLEQALSIVKECATAKFDESIDVAVQLGIDAKKSDQVVRGAVVMPNGTGKTKRVAVFAQGAKAEEAKAAGADIVGMEDLAEQVKAGNLNFDVVIASPDTMRVVGTLGQILGPRGLMPNPKVGTVTPDVATAVRNAKAGQVQFRVDKAGIVHGTIGRRSFDADKLTGNLRALIDALEQGQAGDRARASTCARWRCLRRWVWACASTSRRSERSNDGRGIADVIDGPRVGGPRIGGLRRHEALQAIEDRWWGASPVNEGASREASADGGPAVKEVDVGSRDRRSLNGCAERRAVHVCEE